MTKEYKKFYEYTLTVVEKYKNSTSEEQLNNFTDYEAIAMIFWNYLHEAFDTNERAKNLILSIFGYIQFLMRNIDVEEYLKYEE